jgi:EAL domain-containing protein (putative c-di-GMP-specific phosphodiesterase class I)
MKVYGMEALIRWDSPKLGMVSPAQFIRVLEKSRMINEVGRFVFNEACRSIMRFQKLGYSNLSMSINVSQVQLEDTNFLSNIDEALEKTGVNPELISIEITERIIMSPTENIMNILKELRSRGIKIYIDDFGTEYSSLNYLYKLPIDGIKVDKSFIDRVDCSEKELIILKNIINIARELNIDLVAEGVEKKEQLDRLLQINCPKIQGYFFGKPVCSDEFIKYLI